MKFETKTRPVRILFALALALPLLFLTACDLEEEPIPAYLHVEPFEMVSTDPGAHGSVSAKITHARLFVIDKTTGESHQLGMVALPATIPVLATGEQELNIDPVIKANGNSFFLQIYPFYKRFTKDVTLVPGEELSVTPVTSYKPEAVFEFIEDFEQPGHIFELDRDDNPETVLENSTKNVFEGNYSGRIYLDTANSVIVAQTNGLYDLVFSEVGKVFMEVNYKSPVQMQFGVVAVDNAGTEDPNYEFVVLEKDEWNKIYFDMTDLISTSGTTRFAFIFGAGLPVENGEFSLQEAEIFLDNIKLVHF